MNKNKVIADFMGMKYGEEREFKDGEWVHSIRSLSQFEHDWNWIMSVVKEVHKRAEDSKREYMQSPFGTYRILQIQEHHLVKIQEALNDASIKRVYGAVLGFIELYKKHKAS
jgi:hypothetical protein